MSKRTSPNISEDENPGPLEANSPKKQVKRAQTENLEQNMLNEDKPKKKQASITSFFTMKDTTQKMLDSPGDQEEEQKSAGGIEHKDTEKTEVMNDDASDISHKSELIEEEGIKQDISKMHNVLFYLNKRRSQPQGDFIDNIHKYWRTDYKKLEVHHGYIQWLFPNFYGSAFNGDAYRLTEDEALIFRNSKEISLRLIKSYELILGFYGMVLVDKNTGKLGRATNYQERYKATLITSLHNHLRVRRILTHLNVVGFRKYAVELVDLLEQEIYGEIGGFEKFMEMSKKADAEYIKKVRQSPLAQIIRYQQFQIWRMYGRVRSEDEKELLYKNCFSSDEKDYEDSVFFTSSNSE